MWGCGDVWWDGTGIELHILTVDLMRAIWLGAEGLHFVVVVFYD